MVVISPVSEGSSITHDRKHDVFLSFRGSDTRYSFTDHLYKALIEANVKTFLDEEEIETGLSLKPELEIAIKASRASIIVLSENYASSTWCLNELVLILEQHRTSDHIVIPIFYHVEPTDVRKQQRSFGDAMAELKQRMEAETNVEEKGELEKKMDIWKKALTDVADLKGKDAKGRLETELIEEIVKDVHRRLNLNLRSDLPRLIGMNHSIRSITSWLKDESSHVVDILTISGMGGIGKTSLAKYIYGLHGHLFDKSSFVHDISGACDNSFKKGILDLQKQLCGDFSRSPIQGHDVSVYTSKIENLVSRNKVFIVLDDINSIEQLNTLLGSKDFHPGSKVIITTEDASLTERCALFNLKVPPNHIKHLLNGLRWTESLQLLCIHAFMSNYLKKGYKEVSNELVKYCDGNPLALEVLGRLLRNRDVAYWEEHIEGLKKETDSHINNVLKTSFDHLASENDKELFKHIACFFVGEDWNFTETILKACNIRTLTGITNLTDRCLVMIGPRNELKMHRLLQAMGRDVVRQESPHKPWKRSRIWCHEESLFVLEENRGTGKVQGLILDMELLDKEKLSGSVELNIDALGKMKNLMLLQLNYVQLIGSHKNFPKNLRWLCMRGSPLKYIPLDLQMENLVDLDMSYSNFESFDMSFGNPLRSGNRRKLKSLKVLNLSFCKLLRSISGFFEVPALERLILANCISLIKVSESIKHSVGLVLIDLRNCNMLRNLPRTMVKLKKVETMLLDGCNLGEFPIQTNDTELPEMLNDHNIGLLQTSSSAIVEAIPRHFESLLIKLPSSLVSLSLEDCKLSDASFPMDFSCLSTLKFLKLDRNPIVSLPDCVRSLCKLETLSMQRCDKLKSIVHPPRTLTKLSLAAPNHLQTIVFVQEMSPLHLRLGLNSFRHSSFVIEGMVNIKLMARVKQEVLHSLGWTNLESINNQQLETNHISSGTQKSQVQMYFEFGIFSTLYWGKKIPNWISERSKGSSISFTVPSSPYNLRGLNLCYVQSFQAPRCRMNMPLIRIINKTKNHTWIYNHFIEEVLAGRKYLTSLSHWMMGKNEMEDGDQLTITVLKKNTSNFAADGIIRECGVSFVYDEGEEEEEEEEDVLGYYKSWNHIIGGDLSAFQLTTGEYILHYKHFWTRDEVVSYYHPYIADEARYKGRVTFTAFCKGKPDVRILKAQMEIIEQRQEQEMKEDIEKFEQRRELEMKEEIEKYEQKMQYIERSQQQQALQIWSKSIEQFKSVEQMRLEWRAEIRKRAERLKQQSRWPEQQAELQNEIERLKQLWPVQQAEIQKECEKLKQLWPVQQAEMQKQIERIEQSWRALYTEE